MRGWLRRGVVLILALGALAAARSQPDDPVVALLAGLVQAFAAPGGPSEPAIEALAQRTFDVPAITLAVLGDEGKGATPAQRNRLSHVLVLGLARQLVLAGRQSASDGFTVTATHLLGGGDWLVTTQEARPRGPPSQLTWRVRPRSGRFRIVDTLRDGLSTVGVQHDDFAAELKGRTLDAVIDQMQRRAATPPPGF